MTSPDTSAPADTQPPEPPDAATAGPVVPLHRNRDFLLLWGGSAVSLLGSTATTITHPLLVLALTGSPFAAGPAGFVALLPALLLPLPAGAPVDRWPLRRLMIWCDALRALGTATIAVAAALGVLGLPLVLAVSFTEGALTVFHGLAAHAAVPNVVPPGQLSPTVFRNGTRGRAAVMLGTPLGGVLFGLGRAVLFLADALTCPVPLTGLLFIRGEFEAERAARTGSIGGQVREGPGRLWRHPFPRTTTLLVTGSNLMFRALFLVAIVLAAVVGASWVGVGLMVGFAGAGSVLGSLAAPWFTLRTAGRPGDRGTADRLADRRPAARLGRCADRHAGAGGLDGAHRRRRPGRPHRTRHARPAGSVTRRAPARPRLPLPPHPAGRRPAHTPSIQC
ncbi:MFS transporter [Streptomyces sp. NPDC028722]|uniref:MFS transporter n=1 Tax=Streptomyces sp. NPDC028722 TaxID=3155016 RepID=UPI003400A852